jgi:site-specific recombinase XerD
MSRNDDQPEWQKSAVSAVKLLDTYTTGKLESVEQNQQYTQFIPPIIYTALEAINREKSQKINEVSKSNVKWESLFKEFAADKRVENASKENTLDANRTSLETIFAMLDKKYVNTITEEDCVFVYQNIRKVPVKWKVHFKGSKLSTVIKQDYDKGNVKCLSTRTVKKHLQVFKAFLLFAKEKHCLEENLTASIKVPKKIKDGKKILSFTNQELKKIFNPKTYPKKNSPMFSYRYYVPLIALYSGMRLNEICQLYVDDIKKCGSVYYFHLTDEREDQSLKNETSRRDVPIHSKLIEMGLLDYIEDVRKAKKKQLFYQLKYSAKNHYTGAMGSWFGRYLESIGITGKDKVFHSFRHTVKPRLRDAGISQEYQNMICGWSSNDIGERVYSAEAPILKLSQELEKLQYPFLEDNFQKIIKENTSHLSPKPKRKLYRYLEDGE